MLELINFDQPANRKFSIDLDSSIEVHSMAKPITKQLKDLD